MAHRLTVTVAQWSRCTLAFSTKVEFCCSVSSTVASPYSKNFVLWSEPTTEHGDESGMGKHQQDAYLAEGCNHRIRNLMPVTVQERKAFDAM